MNADQLPDRDRDLQLARALDEAARSGQQPRVDAEDASLLDALAAVRRLRASEAPDSDTLWSAIASQTRPSARIYQLGWRTAAVAATVIALVAFAVFQFVAATPETLLAADQGVVATYLAEDGSTVKLRPNSVLKRSRKSGHYVLTGEAHFSVTPQTQSSFAVETADAIVTVLGTQFVVADWTPGSTVYLEEGSVELRSVSAGTARILAPGELAVVEEGDITVSSSVAGDELLDWLQGAVTFESRRAADVARELSFHFDLDVLLTESVGNEPVSGRILLEEADAALSDLAFILGGEFVADGRTRTFVRAGE